jgi:PEP-CTERM motif
MVATREGTVETRVRIVLQALVLVVLLVFAGHAYADSLGSATVQATAVIYAAGSQSSVASAAGGTVPGGITLPSGATSISFSDVTGSLPCSSSEGCINIEGAAGFLNDPDGTNGPVTGFPAAGTGSLSGLTAPGSGYLVGVFVASGGPSGAAPAALDYTSTNATSYSPLLDQVFFIGDGLTGDGTGTQQTFYAPTGAGALYLGISDICAYDGGPGCYSDNVGAYTLNYDVATGTTAAPEPSAVGLLGIGLLGVLALGFRRMPPKG